MTEEDLVKFLYENIYCDYSGDIFGVEEVAKIIFKNQKLMIETLDNISRWGEQNGGHWSRETARSCMRKI